MNISKGLLLAINAILITAIEVHLTKRNVLIPQNSQFIATVELQR